MGFALQTRGRCWIGTIHIANMEKAGLDKEHYENPEYVATFFKELWENSAKDRTAGIVTALSKNGTYHCHIACYGNTTTLKRVSEILCDSHIEPQLGGKEQLKAYLLKEGKHSEKGEKILYSIGIDNIEDNQGKREDLKEIEALLDEGLTPEQIYNESFRYRRFDKMIKAHYLQKRMQETPLVKNMWNEYHFGESGTGKTYTYIRLCNRNREGDVYLCNDYANSGSSGGGFDFYSNNPAKTIVLDEFRGNIPFQVLLGMLDVYSRNQQHARYQNVYNLWTSVIICSILPPEEVYKSMVDDTQRSIDSIKQLMRRLNVIVYHWKDKEGHFRTYTVEASNYKGVMNIKQKAKEFEDNVSYESYLSEKEKFDTLLKDFEEMKTVEGGEILD